MIIYIEDLFMLNLAVNFVILIVSLNLNKQFVKLYKIFISAVLGASAVVIGVFVNSSLYMIIKFCISFLMIIILRKYKSFKDYIYTYISFLIVTVVLGGGVMAV